MWAMRSATRGGVAPDDRDIGAQDAAAAAVATPPSFRKSLRLIGREVFFKPVSRTSKPPFSSLEEL
jgi:hypothetical protein